MKKAVFIDRDGTIIKDKHYISKVADVEIFENIVDAIRLLNNNSYLVVIITNQSGVGRGFFTEEDVIHLHRYIFNKMYKNNARIDAFYFCPHFPGSKIEKYNKQCSCRKPAPGLLFQAAKDYNIDLSESYIIGDKLSDIMAGENAGLKRGYLLTRKMSIIEIVECIINDANCQKFRF